VPCLARWVAGGGIRTITLGHPLVDDYLAFVAARARTNTWLVVAYDLKVFFEVVGKEPAAVTRADVFGFLAAQRAPRRREAVVRLEDGEPGLVARTIARRLWSVYGLFAYLAAEILDGAGPAPCSPRRPATCSGTPASPSWEAGIALEGHPSPGRARLHRVHPAAREVRYFDEPSARRVRDEQRNVQGVGEGLNAAGCARVWKSCGQGRCPAGRGRSRRAVGR